MSLVQCSAHVISTYGCWSLSASLDGVTRDVAILITDHNFPVYLPGHSERRVAAAPDPGIFERGGSPLAVIYSITNFLFSNEIIEPRLLEKKGLQLPEPPLDPALLLACDKEPK